MSISTDHLEGTTVTGTGGEKLGKVNGVYTDQQTDSAEWVAVGTGLFGNKEALIPVAAGTLTEDGLTVPFTRDDVKNAPHTNPDEQLTKQQEAELFSYYKVPYAGGAATATGAPATTATGTTGGAVQDTSGPNTDEAMTRSEERLHVGTETVETGRARLVKRIVTENVTQTVPVSHEEVTVTREPITAGNAGAAYDGAPLSEEDAEVTLHAERPVVSKETVPVERVKLGTETITDQAEVKESVAHEEIDLTVAEERAQSR